MVKWYCVPDQTLQLLPLHAIKALVMSWWHSTRYEILPGFSSNVQDCSLLINHTATVKIANKNVDEIPQAEWEFSWPVQCRDEVFSLLADYIV